MERWRRKWASWGASRSWVFALVAAALVQPTWLHAGDRCAGGRADGVITPGVEGDFASAARGRGVARHEEYYAGGDPLAMGGKRQLQDGGSGVMRERARGGAMPRRGPRWSPERRASGWLGVMLRGAGEGMSEVGSQHMEQEVQGRVRGVAVVAGGVEPHEQGGAWLASYAGGPDSAQGAAAAADEAAGRQALEAPSAAPRAGKRRRSPQHASDMYFKSVLALDPSNAEIMCEYAEKLLQQDPARAPEAEEHLLRAISLRPLSPSILNRYGLYLERERDDIKQAEEVYEKAIRMEPAESAPALRNLAALVITHLNDKQRAESLLHRALALGPADPRTLNLYGLFLHSSGSQKNIEDAEYLFRLAVAIDDEELDAVNNLAVLAETVRGDMATAETLYKRALAIDQAHVPTLSNYAHHLHALRRDYAGAEVMYKRAVAVNPRHANALSNYAYFLQHIKGEYDSAQQLYKAALLVAPSHESTLVNFAHLASVQQDFDLAESLYRRALGVNPSHMLALSNFGSMLINLSKEDPRANSGAKEHDLQQVQQKHLEMARKLLRRANTLQPAFPPVQELLQQTFGVEGGVMGDASHSDGAAHFLGRQIDTGPQMHTQMRAASRQSAAGVCVRAGARARARVCMCVCARERESICVCVCFFV